MSDDPKSGNPRDRKQQAALRRRFIARHARFGHPITADGLKALERAVFEELPDGTIRAQVPVEQPRNGDDYQA